MCKRASLHQPLLADPGEKWEYGISVDWIGQLIEVVSGQSLRDYLKQNLFAPLGMNDTDFIQTDAQRRSRASVHDKSADGSFVRIEHEVAQNPEFFMGGGGCCGARDDYAAYIRMMLAGGKASSGAQVLKPETVATMASNSIGELSAGVLNSVMPTLSHSADFFPAIRQAWGLSFHLNMEATPEGRSAGSMSWAGLADDWPHRTGREGLSLRPCAMTASGAGRHAIVALEQPVADFEVLLHRLHGGARVATA